ncbi:MAG: SH3 domain-containing protein [Myxococcaceae bacterium]
MPPPPACNLVLPFSSRATLGIAAGVVGEQLLAIEKLKLRASPGVAGERLGVFPSGAAVTVVADPGGQVRAGNWLHVQGRFPGSPSLEARGWVHSAFARKPARPQPLGAPG